jgi:arylamine N-acetyltransferase
MMLMEPGHCCVRVEMPQGPFYADVGYAAPILRAYPLFSSFSLDTHRERFDYSVRPEGIVVTRNPGPSKKLDPTPRRLEELRDLIVAANDWDAPQSFLHRLAYARDVDGVYASLRDGTLTRYLPAGAELTQIASEDAPAVLAEVFGADPDLYIEAAAVRRRHMHAGP